VAASLLLAGCAKEPEPPAAAAPPPKGHWDVSIRDVVTGTIQAPADLELEIDGGEVGGRLRVGPVAGREIDAGVVTGTWKAGTLAFGLTPEGDGPVGPEFAFELTPDEHGRLLGTSTLRMPSGEVIGGEVIALRPGTSTGPAGVWEVVLRRPGGANSAAAVLYLDPPVDDLIAGTWENLPSRSQTQVRGSVSGDSLQLTMSTTLPSGEVRTGVLILRTQGDMVEGRLVVEGDAGRAPPTQIIGRRARGEDAR